MSTVQSLRTPSGDELAVLARSDYEDLVDGARAAEVIARLESGEEEVLTLDETKALLAAPTPLAFWRQRRGLIRSEFATTLGISDSDLAQYESGHCEGTLTLYRRFAEALRVTLDDIAPSTLPEDGVERSDGSGRPA